jgi:hypothetical protein
MRDRTIGTMTSFAVSNGAPYPQRRGYPQRRFRGVYQLHFLVAPKQQFGMQRARVGPSRLTISTLVSSSAVRGFRVDGDPSTPNSFVGVATDVEVIGLELRKRSHTNASSRDLASIECPLEARGGAQER